MAKTLKLDMKAFALTCALLWGGAVLVMGIFASTIGYGTKFIEAIGTIYLGASADPFGVVLGTLYALIDGGIGGAIFAWLYNRLSG